MKNKIIFQDTREQTNKHDFVLNYFNENDYKVIRTKLFVGDYTYLDNQTICVDTKKDIQELVGNVTKDHERFVNEIQRANDNGIKLYFVVCNDENIDILSDVNRWYNKRLRYNPKATKGTTLFKILYSIEKKYNVKFFFTTKENCGETIIKLLDGKLKW